MSEYGYNSYGYGGGYGYAMYLPGGDLDARQGLQGPGTTAHYQQGPYSSYASESDRGGIFEQNTTVGSRDTTTTTSYDYGNSSYRYSHYESHTYYNAPDHYGRAYGENYPVTETYRDSTGIKTYDGAYTHAYRSSTTFYGYSDGTYTQQFTTLSLDYVDGTIVPGSNIGTESSVTGYLGGYTTYSS